MFVAQTSGRYMKLIEPPESFNVHHLFPMTAHWTSLPVAHSMTTATASMTTTSASSARARRCSFCRNGGCASCSCASCGCASCCCASCEPARRRCRYCPQRTPSKIGATGTVQIGAAPHPKTLGHWRQLRRRFHLWGENLNPPLLPSSSLALNLKDSE